MSRYRSLRWAVFIVSLLGSLLCRPVIAQEQPEQPSTQTQTAGKQNAGNQADEAWHFAVTPYLWFAGAHGTVGAFGRTAGVHVSASDLLSHLDVGLLGAAEARRKRFLLNGDLLWLRLSDSKALPFPRLAAVSANFTGGLLIWTSKLGYRVIDHEKLKVDANAGVRYWHLGEKLNFSPSLLGLSFSTSQSWADPLVGGRVQVLLSPKASITALGDVGGWGAGSKQDYQVAGILGYRLNPRYALQGGYRYLFIDYRGSRSSVVNLVTSGVVVGVTINLKPRIGQ